MKRERTDKYGADEILNSVNGIQRAPAPHALFNKIERKLNGAYEQVKVIPMRTVSLAAASVLLLIALNVIMLNHKQQREERSGDKIQQLANYYGLTDNGLGI